MCDQVLQRQREHFQAIKLFKETTSGGHVRWKYTGAMWASHIMCPTTTKRQGATFQRYSRTSSK